MDITTPTEAPPIPQENQENQEKLMLRVPLWAGHKKKVKDVPMEVDQEPEVSLHACWFSSDQFLMFERTLSAVGGQRLPR